MSITAKVLSSEQEDVVDKRLRQQLKTFLKHNKKTKLSTGNGLSAFVQYLENAYNVTLTSVGMGSLVIVVHCPNLKSLETLWNDYCSGVLNEAAEKFLVTDDIKTKINLDALKLQTIITEEDYSICRKRLSEKSGENLFFLLLERGKRCQIRNSYHCFISGVLEHCTHSNINSTFLKKNPL